MNFDVWYWYDLIWDKHACLALADYDDVIKFKWHIFSAQVNKSIDDNRVSI